MASLYIHIYVLRELLYRSIIMMNKPTDVEVEAKRNDIPIHGLWDDLLCED